MITRHSQRTLLIIWVIGALLSIKLGGVLFSGQLKSLSEKAEKPTFSASKIAVENKDRKFSPRQPSVKSGWNKLTESIKQGRNVPVCSNAQRSMNQCK